MARKTSPRPKARAEPRLARAITATRRVVLRGLMVLVAAMVAWVLAYRWIDPPTTPYILAESARLGEVERYWTRWDEIAPVMARSAVAAEDANFCLHWGFDVTALRQAIEGGGARGASTISQQVVKNVFLWQGRSWPRKALEALITPVVELLWPKRRILEVYLNVAETGEGLFGVEAAARRRFGTTAAGLGPRRAALIAAALPAPKSRRPDRPTDFMNRRATAIADGAATIHADGRAACFEGSG
jgi:monofunctional biosynthetic peptidoglycan transglycosylase